MSSPWLSLFLAVLPLTLVTGHGNMIQPKVWMHQDRHIGCGVLDLPPTEHEEISGMNSDCLMMWFSNDVWIPGEPSDLPENMTQKEITCTGQGEYFMEQKPWSAPGTAPIFSPCGTMGGNPNGCPHTEAEEFGDCCGNHCGGFAFGQNAETYEWPDPPTTEWVAGSTQEVAWHVRFNHAGGYSYRLCKMPEGGIGELTEECFQDTPLNFSGEKQWVSYGFEGHPWQDDKEEITAKRTTQGTFPPGSMWTLNPIVPPMEQGGASGTNQGHVIDMVEVPNDLEPGEYVLSFRWDCKCTAQVWAVCSNIMIV